MLCNCRTAKACLALHKLSRITEGTVRGERSLHKKSQRQLDTNMTAEDINDAPPKHNPTGVALVVVAWVTYAATLALNALNGVNLIPGLFLSTIGNVSDKYDNEVVPSGWVFSIWGFIYAWNLAWLIYVTACLFRKHSGGYFYVTPELFPPAFYVIWYVNNFLNIAWLFVWDREVLIAAAVVLALCPFTLYILLFISYRRLDQNGPWLAENSPVDLWLTRGLVHNGLAIYATWTSIATLLNLDIVLIYVGGFSDEDVSTGMFTVLLAEILVWFFLENFVLDRYCRYTLVPYCVVIAALSGNLTKNWDPAKRNVIYVCVLLGVTALLFVVRVALVMWRHMTQPLYVTKSKGSGITMTSMSKISPDVEKTPL
ncbi:Hypp7173 [Branchiostoma lanceolatum]|uniref:Hypp7173 protein n=1 Tax=Branchiostoma lanceolatum TaxID=7740 RepID=A0A8K0ECA0_BRALA|nr:Hypp7173 [Branchiostoma lanceolatum]